MSVARRLRRHWALAVVCAAFLVAGALALGDYDHVTYDGGAQRAIGNAALDYLAGDGDRAFDQLRFPWGRYYGAVVEAPLVLLERAFGPDTHRERERLKHIPMHLFFLFGGVCCYLLVLRLFNNRLLALVAMVLFLLHPRIYAQSFFNSKDVPFLVMFMVSLSLIQRAFRRETLGAFLLCGVGVGLLVNLRVMGIVLFAAVLALRALDLAFAGEGGRSRRAMAGTAGAFALAAVLTYHASLPALWTDLGGRFPQLIEELFSSVGVETFNLFRGEWLYSRYGPPPDYVPVWVGITTPPATLLLAAMGALALARRGAHRPRDMLRDGPVRFGLLLAVLPVAVTVAVVASGSNVFDTWRHLFFLYAPLLLLAVYGLHALLRAGRGRWPRAGAYALAGAAIAVAVVSMVRIHPHERLYFTSLTDRTTPNALASTWEVHYWPSEDARAAFAGIAGEHPSGPLYVSSIWSPGRSLPARERERIVPTRAFRTGERNFLDIHHGQWCPDLPGTRARRVYTLLLHCMVDPAAHLGGLRRAALATEPLDRSRFDAHRVDGVMVYLRDGCSAADLDLSFFLRVHPAAAADRRAPYGFAKQDFSFARYGASIDGNCVAAIPLPDHPIARIETGQYTPEYGEAARRAVAGAAPVARSYFDVWLDADERTLTYVRAACSAEDLLARFRLHVYPVDAGGIADVWRRAEHGFDNLNFNFEEQGVRLEDGACVAVTPLPAYPIAHIHTGQFHQFAHLQAGGVIQGVAWDARFAFSLPEVDPSALSEPLARGVFDVWRDGEALVYVRDGCGETDATARFLLHFYPVDEADLPAARREHGFDNRDFQLWERGGLADGDRCIAVAPLPAYPIASVRTGQYDEDGERWEARFPLVRGEIDATALGEPLARAAFDVWRDADALVYVRDGCTEEEADAAFFLHVYPVDEADLPEAAREHGFENRDFPLWQRGGRAEGRCVAMVALPDYSIARVETGQYDETGRQWEAAFGWPDGE